MSTSLVLGSVGAAVGFAFGGPVGARWGFLAGSMLGSVIDAPDGPSPGDLTAPQIQEGALLPRPYGTVPLVVNFTSVSDYTGNPNPTGGKGGPPEGSAGYTYTLDVLGTIAHRVPSMPLVAITRVWVNKKLVETRLAASTADSLAASAATEAYTSLTLYPGGSAQTPPPEYETRVGTANASGYRNVATVEIIGLVCGGSKTPPLVEVEVITAGSVVLGCLPNGLPRSDIWVVGDDQITHSGPYPGTPTIRNWEVVGSTATLTGFINSFYTGEFTQTQQTFSIYSDQHVSGGCRYAEFCFSVENTSSSNGTGYLGVIEPATVGATENFWGITYGGFKIEDGVTGANNSTSWANDGDIISMAYKDGDLWFGKNGTWPGGLTPATGEPPTFTGVLVSMLPFIRYFPNIPDVTVEIRTAYSQFTYTPPTGFYAWGCDFTTAEIATPTTTDLQDIVDAELAMNPAINLADHDTSDLAGITVRGFKAVGPPGKTIAELGDIFYFDLVPGNPLRYQRRGAAVVGTIANVDTGVGVDEAGAPFTGLKIGNDIERPSVVGLSAPNASADHEPVFRLGDRITTEGPDVEKRRTEVGLIPSEVQGRALAMSLMARASAHTAEYGLSDKYAAAEPGDSYYVYDDQGNLYNKIIRSLTYADGVKQCKWELNDTSALVETGITDADYTPSLVVTAPVDSNLVAIDSPIVRDDDDDAGHYTAIEGEGSEPYPGGVVRRSVDNLDFSEIATTHPTESVVGTATTALGNWTGGYVWDEVSSVTVTVGTGQTLSSSTHAAMQADRSVNSAFLGAHGRWEVIRFRTATLVSTGVYTLTGLLRGMRGTEAHMGAHTTSDTFVLITASGLRRADGEVSEIGQTRYLKAVTDGRSEASATAESFVNNAVGLLPFSPTNLRATRDGSGNITFSIDRRPRKFPRYGGTGGSYTPPADAGETYELDVYATSGYATVLRTLTSSTESFSYSDSQQIADFGSVQATVYTRAYTKSAIVGRGHYLQASA